jgi:hypothetical protein
MLYVKLLVPLSASPPIQLKPIKERQVSSNIQNEEEIVSNRIPRKGKIEDKKGVLIQLQ